MASSTDYQCPPPPCFLCGCWKSLDQCNEAWDFYYAQITRLEAEITIDDYIMDLYFDSRSSEDHKSFRLFYNIKRNDIARKRLLEVEVATLEGKGLCRCGIWEGGLREQ